MFLCVSRTPLGAPVDPLVYMMMAMSSAEGGTSAAKIKIVYNYLSDLQNVCVCTKSCYLNLILVPIISLQTLQMHTFSKHYLHVHYIKTDFKQATECKGISTFYVM